MKVAGSLMTTTGTAVLVLGLAFVSGAAGEAEAAAVLLPGFSGDFERALLLPSSTVCVFTTAGYFVCAPNSCELNFLL